MTDESDSSASGSHQKHSTSLTYSPACKLNAWVSQWAKEEVAEELHISYNVNATTPSTVLEKLACEDLTKHQRDYVHSIKTYLTFNVDHPKDFCFRTRTEPLKEKFLDIKKIILAEPDRFQRGKVLRFVRAVERLMNECAECSQKIYEGTFTHFVGEFADLCCLQPLYSLGNVNNDYVIWENFRGLKSVLSTPDLRFMKDGLPDDGSIGIDEPEMIVSVAEVKKESEIEILGRKAVKNKIPTKFIVDILKRMIQPSSYSNSSLSESSSESSSAARLSSKTIRNKKTRNFQNADPLEIDFLPSKLLGQHAGELLFDLNKCVKNSDITDEKLYTMPGMIVDSVRVIFTMLEISGRHLMKLRNNKLLDHDDQAHIYYSVDYNILNHEHRDILLESFMRLNNIRTYGHNEQRLEKVIATEK